jgi:hypothetical protein
MDEKLSPEEQAILTAVMPYTNAPYTQKLLSQNNLTFTQADPTQGVRLSVADLRCSLLTGQPESMHVKIDSNDPYRFALEFERAATLFDQSKADVWYNNPLLLTPLASVVMWRVKTLEAKAQAQRKLFKDHKLGSITKEQLAKLANASLESKIFVNPYRRGRINLVTDSDIQDRQATINNPSLTGFIQRMCRVHFFQYYTAAQALKGVEMAVNYFEENKEEVLSRYSPDILFKSNIEFEDVVNFLNRDEDKRFTGYKISYLSSLDPHHQQQVVELEHRIACLRMDR